MEKVGGLTGRKKGNSDMYYRLNDDYALRAWKFVNHAMYHRYSPAPLRGHRKKQG